jgi:hypothetical protein
MYLMHTHIHIYIIEAYSLDVSQVAAVLLDIIQHCKVAPTYIHGIGHIRT